MIQARNICLSFGDQAVFDSISFTLNQNQRIGLVGLNGSGKSTLLKAIANQQHLDDGNIAVSNKTTIAYMPQEVVLESDKSIIDETLMTFEHLIKIQHDIALMDDQLAHNPEMVDLELYTDLQMQLADYSPAKMRAQTQRVLIGLGFHEAQMEKPVADLSVGWKMRIVLAKLLLKNADFYLFDEPTNHLDIVAKDWFLEFLKTSSFGFLLVSHERYFLDKLCDEILELELGKATFYSGNYSKYVVQKEHNLALLQAAQVQQQKEIKQKQEFIDRFRASASRSKQAQSVARALDKIERITLPPKPKTITFHFPIAQQPGRIVLTVKNLAQQFGNKEIFSNVNFEIERGEKVGVIAPNGVGKTTLFNLIVGALPRMQGNIDLGYNALPAIFAQDQTKSLNGNKTILENVIEQCPKKLESNIRSFLGAFLFSSDDVHKKVKVLSGGEKNRVGMVCVLLQDANFLLLDEPTNHLDIPSKEILLQALKSYQGTILFVSHDHDFVNNLATRILELTPTGINSYFGNYESYLYQKQHNKPFEMANKEDTIGEKQNSFKSSESKKENEYELNKHSKKLEHKIEKLEKEIQKLELRFAELVYGTLEFKQTNNKLQKLKGEHNVCFAEWESLMKKK